MTLQLAIKSTLRAVLPHSAISVLRRVYYRYLSHYLGYFLGSRNLRVRDVIARYRCGRVLEIGPGKSPYCEGSDTVYLDKYTGNKDGAPAPDIIADAASIPEPDESFDFVFSSHCLEHCQNTLKTLYEWKRVLRPRGVLCLVLPHAERSIDRYRALTTLDHHIADYRTLTDAFDRSHCEEMKAGWLQLEDLDEKKFEQEWGFPCWDWDQRFQNGVLHFHVWTQNEMLDVLRYIGLDILFLSDTVPDQPDSFVIVARK